MPNFEAWFRRQKGEVEGQEQTAEPESKKQRRRVTFPFASPAPRLRKLYTRTRSNVWSIVSLGTKPTICSLTLPPLKTSSAGIPRMP